MNVNKHPSSLRINVGFLLNETAGYSREIEFEEAVEQVSDDLTLRNLHGNIRFTRTAQGILGQGELAAELPGECVRCLTELSQPLAIRIDDLFAYPPVHATDPLLRVSEDGHINLAPLVREYMLLEVPLHSVCRPECKGLCPICGADRNTAPCNCEDDAIDPRLAALKSLLDE